MDREVVVETTAVTPAPADASVTRPPPATVEDNPPTDSQVTGATGPAGTTPAGMGARGVTQPPTGAPGQQPASADALEQAPSLSLDKHSNTASAAPASAADPPNPFDLTDPDGPDSPARSSQPQPQPQPIPHLERLSISETSAEGLVESPAVMSPLATRPGFERTESSSTNESRKNTVLPGSALAESALPPQADGMLSPISAGPSLLASTHSLRKGTGDSGRTLRGARHWSRDDVPPHSPDDGLGKDSMVICEDEDEEEDVCHGTVSPHPLLWDAG